MSKFEKFGLVTKSDGKAPSAEVMAKINRYTLRELGAEEVFVFRFRACDDQIDRDHERFDPETLREMAPLFLGKPVLQDHNWSAGTQTARIFDAALEKAGEVTSLVLSAYMLRNEGTADTIAAIEGGILKEVSVGCVIEKAVCSVCGTDKRVAWCDHFPGREYEGKTCYIELQHAVDCYETSLVAVPAQPGAGVVKAYGGEENRPQPENPADKNRQKALALLELEEKSL